MPGPGYYVAGEEELNEVLEVLKSGHLSRYGSDEDPRFLHKVYTFERELAALVGAEYCLGVNSGTSALMACLVAAGVGPGDEVLVPGYTFVATYSAAIAIGAVPVLVEVDESLTIDPEDARRKAGPRAKAIMPVHMLGNPSNLDALCALAKEKGLAMIEDCCQADGASYRGRRVGTFGELGAFSLNNYKVINTGDGGMLVTSSRELYERAFGFHDQGHLPLRKGVEIGNRTLVGINMRMNELTGAYALAQLRKIDSILGALRERKARFKAAISQAALPGLGFRRINDPGECATLLTLVMKERAAAVDLASALKSKTLERSGWHVYGNMEQLLAQKDASGKPRYHKGMLPATDDILSRAINLSVGVVDPGIGADFGITVKSSNDEIDAKAEEFISLARPILG